jgi:LmbE family N-acetylglucosaminyl deacetylase
MTEVAASAGELQPRRAMVIVAHPDDAEFLCGGTIAKMCAEGWEVTYVVATSGDKGTSDPTLAGQRLAAIREAEQSAAARVLGVRECIYLRHPDGFLENSDALRGEIVHLLRTHRPETVITWDAYRRGFNHRDHRVVGITAYDAVFPAARDPLYYPEDQAEGLDAHKVRELLLAGSEQPDYVVEISDHFETKLEAVYCHTSQIEALPREEFMQKRRQQAVEAGRQSGMPFAEAFRRITLRV